MKQYFFADKVFVYPSANAKDGGSDNSEKNLALITDKFTTANFVVRNKEVSLEEDNSLALSVSNSGNLIINKGACVINGYYVSIDETEILPDSIVQENIELGQDTLGKTYCVYINLHHDGSGLVRGSVKGDSGSLGTKDICYGVSYGILSEASYSNFNNKTNLLLGKVQFVLEDGNLSFDKNSIVLSPTRFAFIDSETIRDKEGRTVDQAIDVSLRKLSKLCYWNTPQDAELPNTTPDTELYVQSGALMFKPSASEEAYNLLDKIKCAEENKQTLAGTLGIQTPTNNGIAVEHARADHDHDNRYILSGTALSDTSIQTIKSYLTLSRKLTGYSAEFSQGLSSRSLDVGNGGMNISGILRSTKDIITSDSLTVTEAGSSKVVFYVASKESVPAAVLYKDLDVKGTITGTKVYNAVWNDYAELYKKADSSKEYEPGTVIAKVRGKDVYDEATYSDGNLVVGVVSDSYGHLLGGDKDKSLEENLKEYIPIALSGRVYVKVYKGAIIEEGDLLYQSGIPGRATGRSVKINECDRGFIIGKALESTDGTKDKILMQVMLG